MSMGTGTVGGGKENQVTREIVRSNNALEILHKTIAELEARLSGILSSQEPTPTTNEKENQALVPMAIQLQGIRNGISNAISMIQSILKRIEL